jgi:hypothetical protein
MNTTRNERGSAYFTRAHVYNVKRPLQENTMAPYGNSTARYAQPTAIPIF